jgi:hypothetical protein
MTEQQWAACVELNRMLEFIRRNCREQVSDRKFKLLAVACCRRVWQHMPDDRSRRAVEVAELFADGESTRDELSAAQFTIRGINSTRARSSPGLSAASAARHAAGIQRHFSTLNAASDASWAAGGATNWAATMPERQVQAGLLRDVLGPVPFQPLPVLDAAVLAWNNGCVVNLATGAYQERDFAPERLGVLADALEDAGYNEVTVLSHLRVPGLHVRGCWALDLILGRS